ncbi:MAG: type II secretion system F family protein, partial [Chromatiales bacterium]|nr:type II secretion system F family protein [Chromatiales bacterium]
LRPRLRRAAAPLAGPAAGETRAEGEQSIFRKTERRSRLAWLRRPIESRYPLLDARRAFPVGVGAGLASAALAWLSIWVLKIPAGGWTLPVCGIAGAGGLWYALGWQQARQVAAFVRQFPEVVDQIVRLAGAGVPAVEALTVVAEDAPPPIRPILEDLCDSLLAGIDTDTALRMATERTRLAEFTMFAAVIRLQRRSGGGISTAFANLSKTLRERHKTSLKAHATTAQSRLTLLVLAVIPVLVLLAQKFTSPASVEVLFDTEQGKTLLRAGVGLIVTGLLAARAIAARVAR